MHCTFCQEEFDLDDETVSARRGRIEVSSRRFEPVFIPDDEDSEDELYHPYCLSAAFVPEEEQEVRQAIRDSVVSDVGAAFQEYLVNDYEEVDSIYEEDEDEPQPERQLRRGRSRFRVRR